MYQSRLIGLVGGLLTLVACVPSARGYVYGLDVYHGNGTMNWPLIAGAGKDFAFVKATEGIGFTDASLTINENGGTSAGMLIGCYDFARPDTNSPVSEADYYVSAATAAGAFASGKLLPMLDLETVGHTGSTTESAWANAWCAEVKAKTGLNAIIYTYPSFAHSNLDTSVTNHPLFMASYDHTGVGASVISPWTTWAFWQYTSTGRVVGGPAGSVDLDIYNGNLTSLISSYAIGGVAPALATPTPEPAAATLLLGAAVVATRRRRRISDSHDSH